MLKDGDSTACLGSLFQCLTTLMVKIGFALLKLVSVASSPSFQYFSEASGFFLIIQLQVVEDCNYVPSHPKLNKPSSSVMSSVPKPS